MVLYNFFTEVVSEKRIENLKEIKSQIIECFEGKGHCEIVLFTGFTGEKRYSIIGQIYGDDTSVGDTDLSAIFGDIKYTWLDAFTPTVNNITN